MNNLLTAELKWPGPEPGRSRSRQNFDPEPKPPKSRAAPQPCQEPSSNIWSTLFEQFWRILLYVTFDAISKFYVT